MKTLTKLNLCHNELTELPENIFVTLQHLKHLDLSFNRLKKLHEFTFRGLDSLETLKLGNNKLTTLPDNLFVDQHSLLKLLLRANQLVRLPEKLLATTVELVWFHLDNNRLEVIPKSMFSTNDKMKRLSLEWNSSLKEVPPLPKNLEGFGLSLPKKFNNQQTISAVFQECPKL